MLPKVIGGPGGCLGLLAIIGPNGSGRALSIYRSLHRVVPRLERLNLLAQQYIALSVGFRRPGQWQPTPRICRQGHDTPDRLAFRM
jgi:hypothetical protein